MRRMATGGLILEPISDAKKRELGIAADNMALAATHVGQYGNHARAKRAGIRKGDILVSIDGRDDLLTENAVLEYALQSKSAGDRVQIEFVRGSQTHKTHINLQ